MRTKARLGSAISRNQMTRTAAYLFAMLVEIGFPIELSCRVCKDCDTQRKVLQCVGESSRGSTRNGIPLSLLLAGGTVDFEPIEEGRYDFRVELGTGTTA